MPRVSKCLNLGRVLWEGRRSNFPSALQHETSTTKLELSYAIPGEVEKNLPVENKGAYMPTLSRCPMLLHGWDGFSKMDRSLLCAGNSFP